MSMPSGPKHVLSGASHPGNHGHGEFNQSPGDATAKITDHFAGAGRMPGGGETGGVTRTPGDQGYCAVSLQNDHDWDDMPPGPMPDSHYAS
jgi:hypothetical protein